MTLTIGPLRAEPGGDQRVTQSGALQLLPGVDQNPAAVI